MRTIGIVALAIYLGGCTLGAPLVKSDSLSYDDVIEDTTDKMLLTNVLRARDRAPLHFTDVGKISESIKAGLALKTGTDPSQGLSYEVDPSFDLSHVVSKEFATGIASPIDPKVVKYWLDRGLDRRVLLFLFFSSANITLTKKGEGGTQTTSTISVLNSPRADLDGHREWLEQPDSQPNPSKRDLDCPRAEFSRYLRLINSLEVFEQQATSPKDAVAVKDVPLDPKRPDRVLSALASFDPSKYTVKCEASKCSVELVPKDSNALCYKTAPWYGKKPVVSRCTDDATNKAADASMEAAKTAKPILYSFDPKAYCDVYNAFAPTEAQERKAQKFRSAVREGFRPSEEPPSEAPDYEVWMDLKPRSVGEVIQYLGDLLALEEYLADRKAHGAKVNIHSPLTLGYCEDGYEDVPGCGDYLFRVEHDESDSRFTMTYRNRDYSIAPYSSPTREVRDHSIEVLGVLNQLIGLHREAKDIQSTQTVRVIP